MMGKKRILVSACLLGLPCRYDGRNKADSKLLALAKKEDYLLIPFCPECYGGLPIPRSPSERKDGRVISAAGEDVSAQYHRGAESALALCRILDCKTAILKARSPSCGSGQIYDGSFTKTLIPGDGVTAQLLKENGIIVLTEDELT